MELKKTTAGSLIAGALITLSAFSSGATGLFHHSSLGNGGEVRGRLLGTERDGKTLELKCGNTAKSDTAMKKGKDGKCGEGKCGNNKSKADSMKTKGKDGNCGNKPVQH